MKTRILSLLSLLLTTSMLVSAQNNKINFMGIPIEGDFEVFCNNLVKKNGLLPTYEEGEFVGLETREFYGDFWKFKGCKISVRRIVGDKNVSSVHVTTSEPDDIYKLEELLKKYDNLYGPHEVEENPLAFEVDWTFPAGNIHMVCWKQYINSIIIIYSNNVAINHLKSKDKNVDDDL